MFFSRTLNVNVERWKLNKDYNCLVSSQGRFRTADGHLMKLAQTEGGYYAVKLSKRGGKKKNFMAHRIVLETFKPLTNCEKMTVDHINGNKRDNCVANLEWVTEEENLNRTKAQVPGVIEYIVVNNEPIPKVLFMPFIKKYAKMLNVPFAMVEKQIQEKEKHILGLSITYEEG